MTSIINHFLVLDSYELKEGKFQFRFVPDFFDYKVKQPILRLSIITDKDSGKLQKLADMHKGDIIDDIDVDGDKLAIWLEAETEPYNFTGYISWLRDEYEVSDYVCHLEGLKRVQLESDKVYDDVYKRLQQGLSFIDRTIDRIERKQQLIKPDHDIYLKQIKLLRTVRQQLDDEE